MVHGRLRQVRRREPTHRARRLGATQLHAGEIRAEIEHHKHILHGSQRRALHHGQGSEEGRHAVPRSIRYTVPAESTAASRDPDPHGVRRHRDKAERVGRVHREVRAM